MYIISSMYPSQKNGKFNYDYYFNIHMPMSIKLLSRAKGYKGVSVEKMVDNDDHHIKSPYIALCRYYFESLENFIDAFTPHADILRSDIKNYTNIEPVYQISIEAIAQ